MIIKNKTSISYPVNCLERILPELSIHCKFNDEEGDLYVKLLLSNTPDFEASTELEIPNGLLGYKIPEFATYTYLPNSKLNVPVANTEYDLQVNHMSLAQGILPEYLKNLSTLYCKFVFFEGNKVKASSQYFTLTFSSKLVIEISDNERYTNPIKAISLILNHRIFGNPDIKIYVSNNIDVHGTVGREWINVTDSVMDTGKPIVFNNIEKTQPSQSEFYISIKIEVSKVGVNDHYQFFGYLLSTVESKFYKRYIPIE